MINQSSSLQSSRCRLYDLFFILDERRLPSCRKHSLPDQITRHQMCRMFLAQNFRKNNICRFPVH